MKYPSRPDASPSLSLNSGEIAAALRRGGLTFDPRSRNKLVCNQAPRLGRMTSKQAHALRSQVRAQKVQTAQKAPGLPSATIYDSLPKCGYDDGYCTRCHHYPNPTTRVETDKGIRRVVTCTSCGQKMLGH